MNLVDTAKAQVKQIVEKVAEKVTDAATTDSRVQEVLGELTGDRGPDAVIEAVGMKAHSTGGACAPYDLFKNKSDGCIRVALRP